MPTITIRLDEDTGARLKRRLERDGRTLSDFVREAVTRQLDETPRKQTRLDALARTLDILVDGAEPDLSETYKTRIRERLSAKHRR